MTTKGPSLDAIKRFKEQQEQKKREEDERKIREKLNTLEHRSTHGDRKAKQVLKKIRDTIEKPPPPQTPTSSSHKRESSRNTTSTQSVTKPKPKTSSNFDFEELMKIAKQNKDKAREKPQTLPTLSDIVSVPKKNPLNKTPEPTRQVKSKPKSIEPERSNKAPAREIPQIRNVAPPPQSRDRPQKNMPPRDIQPRNMPPKNMPPRDMPPKYRDYPPQRQMMPSRRPIPSTSRYEDEYESDGFVVSDEDDDARAELNETLRSVFRYDRRRCDLREEELDRQYRAIGNVSTFEDLEREERRASRLAAAEDARALRDEEERKRLKKLRFEKSQKEEKKRNR